MKAKKIDEKYIDGNPRYEISTEVSVDKLLSQYEMKIADQETLKAIKTTKQLGTYTQFDLMKEKQELEEKIAEVQTKLDAITIAIEEETIKLIEPEEPIKEK